MRFRLFTLVLIGCCMMIVARGIELLGYSDDISYFLASLQAQENQANENTDPAPEATEDTETAESTPETPLSVAEQMIQADENLSTERPEIALPLYSDSELDILQRLSERRKQLEAWEKELSAREKILNVSQARIQNKIEELRILKAEIESKLEEFELKEDEKTQSLVKIYENMKPKSAAQIFSQMEMPTLIEVVRNMKERSAAPIIARMDTMKAKALTEEIARLGKLAENVTDMDNRP